MVHVELATHFNEDAFSHGLARGLADRLRVSLRGVGCPEHGDDSTIRVSTEGVAQTVNDIRVEIEGCCDRLRAEVERIVGEVTGEAEHG